MIQGFGQDIVEIPAFGHDITEVRAMGQLVWQKSIPDYLCFTALESGTFTLTIPAAVTTTELAYVEYSKNGRTWTRLSNVESTQVSTSVNVSQDDVVYWRGSGLSTGCTNSKESGEHTNFSSTADFNISGNIMSLLYPTDFDNVTSFEADNGFCNLFKGNTHLISAANLLLPVTTATNYCYFGMFRNCSHMTIAPAIGLTSFASKSMVCRSMFNGCSSLVVAPVLSVATLASQCYYYMFYGCSLLNYIKCLATDISATNCLNNWLQNVSSTGTFIQAEGVTWPRGASGIPTGWVDVEKRTMPQGYKQVEYLQAVKPYPTNYNAAIVGTGIVFDPSQDTIEYAVWPRLDEDGYLINGGGSTAGEMPFANTSSPTTTTAKVGLFYILYRVNSSTNLFSTFFTRENGDGTNKALGSSLDVINKVTDSPQTIRVEFSATSSVMYLNGTQVASRSGYTVDTSDMTTMQAFVLAYNNRNYSWEHPFYYLKWWRGGTMIADYVPCVRESDDEVGFYDFVSQTFKTRYYTNSEPFTAGEEI